MVFFYRKFASVNTVFAAKLTWVLMLCLLSLSSYAQHFNFSQYNYNHLRVNPALVATDNDAYAILHYRSQGTSAFTRFNSSMFSLTHPLMSRKSKKRWGGVGLSVMDDRASEAGMYSSQTIAANFAYNIIINSNQMLSLGMQGNYFSKRISTDGLTTGSQYIVRRGYDPSASLGETFDNVKTNYFTASTGAFWYSLDEYDRKKAYAGIAFRDINKPNEALQNLTSAFPMTMLAHAGVRVYENGRSSVTPEVLFSRSAGISLLNVGSTYSYALDDRPSASSARMDMAARYVVGKTAILSAQFVQKSYVIGFSYDFPISQSVTSNALHSAPEVILALKKTIEPGNKKKKHKKKKKKKAHKKKRKKKTARKAVVAKKPEVTKPEKAPVEKAKPVQPIVKTEPTDSLPKAIEKAEQPIVTSKPAPMNNVNKKKQKPIKPNIEKKVAAKDPVATNKKNKTPSEKNILDMLNEKTVFEFNRPDLSQEVKKRLDELVTYLNENPTHKLTLIGHTDTIGDKESNDKISRERAEKVLQYLVAQGINESRLKAEGKGFSSPKYPNNTAQQRAKNRRVEFVLEQE